MGITIHYTFVRGRDPATLMDDIEKLALALGMRVARKNSQWLLIDPDERSETIELHWARWKDIAGQAQNGDDWELVREVIGRYYAELVRAEDWVCLGFVKTQFAGVDCHCAVAKLLRAVAGRCRLAEISDEGGYYEGGDESISDLKARFDWSSKAISDLAVALKAAFGAENVLCGQDLAEQTEGEP